MKDSEYVSLFFLGCFAALSIIITIIYLCYFIDCKNTKVISLIISAIFFFAFVFLNLMLILDYYLSTNSEEVTKDIDNEFVAKFLSYFYSYFNRINSIMNLIILPFMINCLETGYYSICRIILESLCRLGHSFWKLLKKSLFKVLLILALVLGIGVVILYYMFKDKYELKEPLYYFDYIALASNIKSLIEIYINVGFFMVQIFIDSKYEGSCFSKACCCCRDCCNGNPDISRKYYFFSIRLIVEKTKKYFKKIKEANEALNKEVKKYNNDTNSKFHKFLLKKLQLIHADLELYKYDEAPNTNNINNNIFVHREYNINLNLRNQPSLNMRNQPEFNDKSESVKRIIQPETEFNKVEIKTSKEKNDEDKISQKQEIVKDEEKESEKILADHIRKYKKSTRKIKKLKKLCNDLTEEININLDINPKRCNFFHKNFKTLKYFILYLSFAMVLITDILLPFSLYTSEGNNNNTTDITVTDSVSQDDDEDGSGNVFLDIIVLIFAIILLISITCSYSIIMLYSINRREYVSGDFLSGKKINDTISLMKTLKKICAYSFPLVYLNFYFWKTVMDNDFIFYERIYIPDYELKHGVGIFMLAKIVVIIFSIIVFKCGCLLKNDMAEFNKHIGDSNYSAYEDQMKFNYEMQNEPIYQVLINKSD